MRSLKLRVVQQHFLTTHFEGIEANKHITPPSPSIAAVAVVTLHNMDTSFNLENFISNLASLARQPFDPEALPDLLEQVTGHRWERSASTSTSAASAPSVPSAPSASSASTPHLAAAAAAAGGGGGDARQEGWKEQTRLLLEYCRHSLQSKITLAAAIRLDSNCKHAHYGPSLTIRLQILTEICNYYQSTRMHKRSVGRSKLVSYFSTADIRYRARSPLPLLFDLIAITSTHNMGQV
eukprot:scaffold3881_cov100-Skeletonema_marinoi.AAC.1